MHWFIVKRDVNYDLTFLVDFPSRRNFFIIWWGLVTPWDMHSYCAVVIIDSLEQLVLAQN
ncbi:MAG: hypothetical protein KC517_07135 [Bacteroidetes bacterium]|nr:hypothetical protein [Bacteroidota bacterium]